MEFSYFYGWPAYGRKSTEIKHSVKNFPNNILISRTDSIGDVVLTLPVAGVLKKNFPNVKIGFLGKSYTRAVIEACQYVDAFIDLADFLKKPVTICGQKPEAILHVLPVAEIARRAKSEEIPLRVGTTNRLYHWTTCNRLVRLSRKNSPLHEAQLNLKLLEPFDIPIPATLTEIGQLYGIKPAPLDAVFSTLIDHNRYALILHPKSQGNGREWPLDHFIRLIQTLDRQQFQIFISGTKKDRALLQPLFDQAGDLVTDMTGQMELAQFISFINACDGLIASGTGPLHLAAALGKDAYGIFPPIRPVHPGRWKPLGIRAQTFCLEKDCNDCRSDRLACTCMRSIEPYLLKDALEKTFSHA